MGSVGDAYDNAMCGRFFGTLECERLDRRRLRSHAEARMAVIDYLEGFYNPRRRDSALDSLSPGTRISASSDGSLRPRRRRAATVAHARPPALVRHGHRARDVNENDKRHAIATVFGDRERCAATVQQTEGGSRNL
jgi:hypothetical protein